MFKLGFTRRQEREAVAAWVLEADRLKASVDRAAELRTEKEKMEQMPELAGYIRKIDVLLLMESYLYGPGEKNANYKATFNGAILALCKAVHRMLPENVSQCMEAQGTWQKNKQGYHSCPICGLFAVSYEDWRQNDIEILTDCCPHCGARLEEE